MDDPFRTLGVERDATLTEIKRAYRALAKELHPDRNPGDDTAAERFKLVSAAYGVLTDPERRARYERGSGGSTWGGGFSGFDGPRGADDAPLTDEEFGAGDTFSDLFGDIAGNRRGRGGTSMWLPGEDAAEIVKLGFVEAAVGATRKVMLFDMREIEVAIPAGIRHGEAVAVPGLGFPGFGGGPPGDLNVVVEITPDEVLSRDGFDVIMELSLSADQLKAGGRHTVRTIGGEMGLDVPAGAKPGQVLELPGMGFKDPESGRRGVQKVTLRRGD